jgi:hypothetical protein
MTVFSPTYFLPISEKQMSMSDVGYRRYWGRCRCPPMHFDQVRLALSYPIPKSFILWSNLLIRESNHAPSTHVSDMISWFSSALTPTRPPSSPPALHSQREFVEKLCIFTLPGLQVGRSKNDDSAFRSICLFFGFNYLVQAFLNKLTFLLKFMKFFH